MITSALTEKLEIEQIVTTTNELGIDVPDYIPFRTIYASITAQRGATSFDEGQRYTDRIAFYCRYSPDIQKKGFVIRYNGELYDIENITHVRRSQATVIDCKAIS